MWRLLFKILNIFNLAKEHLTTSQHVYIILSIWVIWSKKSTPLNSNFIKETRTLPTKLLQEIQDHFLFANICNVRGLKNETSLKYKFFNPYLFARTKAKSGMISFIFLFTAYIQIGGVLKYFNIYDIFHYWWYHLYKLRQCSTVTLLFRILQVLNNILRIFKNTYSLWYLVHEGDKK